MSIFVDDEDMVKLTGYHTPRKQIQQLREMGVPFRVNGMGRPMVTLAAIEGGRDAAPAPARQKVTSPVFERR